jgi:hypothetical protein
VIPIIHAVALVGLHQFLKTGMRECRKRKAGYLIIFPDRSSSAVNAGNQR